MQLVVNQWVLDARNVKPPNHLPPAGPRSQTASSQHCVCALPRSHPSALPQRLIGHNYTAELSLSQSLHRGERDPPMGPDLRHKATGGGGCGTNRVVSRGILAGAGGCGGLLGSSWLEVWQVPLSIPWAVMDAI